MKKGSLTYRIAALLLVFLIILGSTGVSLDLHFCQGNFKNLAVNKTAKTCHEIMKDRSSHCKKKEVKEESDSSCENNCCHSEKVYVEPSDQLFQSDFVSLQDIQPEAILVYIVSYFDLSELTCSVPEYLSFKPPSAGKDIRVLVQSFLF